MSDFDFFEFGTITLTNASAAFSIPGAVINDVRQGDTLYAQGVIGVVDAINNDLESGTLRKPWAGAGGAGLVYTIAKTAKSRFENATAVAQLGDLLGFLRSGETSQLVPSFPPNPGFRLTLSPDPSAAVTEADYVGQTTLFVAPAVSDVIPVFDDSLFQVRRGALMSIPLDPTQHPADKAFDVFAWWDGSTLQAGTTVNAYTTNNTKRPLGDGATEVFRGLLVNKNAVTLRNAGSTVIVPPRRATLIGGFNTYMAGQTEDSRFRRFVSNASNAVRRQVVIHPQDVSWAQDTASGLRLWNNNLANVASWFHCVGGRLVSADATSIFFGDTSASFALIAIGIDSSTTASSTSGSAERVYDSGATAAPRSHYEGYPGLGKHYAFPLEQVAAGSVVWARGGPPQGGAAITVTTSN